MACVCGKHYCFSCKFFKADEEETKENCVNCINQPFDGLPRTGPEKCNYQPK